MDLFIEKEFGLYSIDFSNDLLGKVILFPSSNQQLNVRNNDSQFNLTINYKDKMDETIIDNEFIIEIFDFADKKVLEIQEICNMKIIDTNKKIKLINLYKLKSYRYGQRLSKMYEFTKKKKFVDFYLNGKSKKNKSSFPVHSSIISSSSDAFKAAIISNFQESINKQIIINDFASETIGNAIEYIYKLFLPKEKVTLELLRFADKYNIIDLSNYVQLILIKQITIENFGEYLLYSDMTNANILIHELINFGAKNRDALMKQDYWLSVADKNVRKILETSLGKGYTKNDQIANVVTDKNLQKLLLDNDSYDIKLKVGHEFISAHRIVLSAFSETFAELLKDEETKVIDLTDYLKETVQFMINFIYLREGDKYYTVDLYRFTCEYKFLSLKSDMEKFYNSNINEENAVDLFFIARKQLDTDLAMNCIKYIKSEKDKMRILLNQLIDVRSNDELIILLLNIV